MNDPQQPEEPSEENLFAAPQALELPEDKLSATPQARVYSRAAQTEDKAGLIAITISILLALLFSIPVFMVTFFVTCLGIFSVKGLDNEAGLAITAIIALATSIVSLILATKAILALIRDL